MSWITIPLAAGVNLEQTPTMLMGGYANSWNLRFKSGLAQKIGGWNKFLPYSLPGIPKSLFTYQTNELQQYLAVGTSTTLAVIQGNTNANGMFSAISETPITPQYFSSNTPVNMTTIAGNTYVKIVDANINTVSSYCSVYFNTPVSIDGIILAGLYQIQSSASSNSYYIIANTPGLAGVANGGTVPNFSTTASSPIITVSFPYHGLSNGSTIDFPINTNVATVSINGIYNVLSVTDGNNFTISGSSQANATVSNTYMNSGNAQFYYYIGLGPTPKDAPYGSGTYGDGAYGIGVVSNGMTGSTITATDWTLSNWGEDLIACQENGPIFYWPPNQGIQNALTIPNGPPFNTGAFVSTAQQMIIAYGSCDYASIGVFQDPLLVKWCAIQDFTTWFSGVNNQAGSFKIPTGSKIVGGIATPLCNLIWTDIELWTMNYIGAVLVFGFVRTGSNCGLIGKHAFTQLAGNVFWLSRNNIFAYTGGSVQILPCTVWDAIFQDLDLSNASTCWVGSNALYSEIIIAYPSIQDATGYPTRYVKLNVTEGTWDIGQLQRNCWIDQSIFGPPLSITVDGIVYSHETGNDADNVPMVSGFTTGYTYLDEGRQFVFIDKIIPDFIYHEYGQANSAILSITVNAINEMGDVPVSYGPYTITETTNEINTRIRARQVSLTIQSSDSGSFWRLGKVRYRITPDGRR